MILISCSKQLSKAGEKFGDVLLCDASSSIYDLYDKNFFCPYVAGLDLDFATSLSELHSIFY